MGTPSLRYRSLTIYIHLLHVCCIDLRVLMSVFNQQLLIGTVEPHLQFLCGGIQVTVSRLTNMTKSFREPCKVVVENVSDMCILVTFVHMS